MSDSMIDFQFPECCSVFPEGALVRIDLPGDPHHGKSGLVRKRESARTRKVSLIDDPPGLGWHYCIAALKARSHG